MDGHGMSAFCASTAARKACKYAVFHRYSPCTAEGVCLDKSQCVAGRTAPFIARSRRKRGSTDGANRMFPLSSSLSGFARDRRAAVRQSSAVTASRASCSTMRTRKGVRAATKNSWRRISTGSNHISAFGVWRDRSRRVMTRVNRTGETRWHRLPSAGPVAGRSVMP